MLFQFTKYTVYNKSMNAYQSYYPRPLLKRDPFFSLCGTWDLNGHDIEVPFPPESQASGYEGEMNELIYRKSFSLDEGFVHENDKVILHFSAVDQIADVYLNDHFLLHHEGGYLPFSMEISDLLEKENELKVIVKDDLDLFYPYGKQSAKPSGMWYTPVSGIWQSVWIESYDRNGIDDLKIETDDHTLKLHIESRSEEFHVSFDGFEKTFKEKDITIDIPDGHLWSLEDPYLYDLSVKTNNDAISSYFALRKIGTKTIYGHQRIFLNDKPLFLNGLLDQGYFESGIYLPEDPKEYEREILAIKEMGFNCLRKHIKVEIEAYYHYCDKHGILVLQDMVNNGPYRFLRDTILPTIGLTHLSCPIDDQKRYDFFLRHCKETIEHLRSHPCIIGYTIYNEGWGQQAASKTYDILKKLDPHRLFDSTSGWFFDDHSDFDSYHIYFRNKVLKGKEKLLLLSECGGFIRQMSENPKKAWGYGKAESEEELTAKIIDMHEKMVLPSIDNGLVGYIMTQISDVEGEVNGLFTYDRRQCKVDKEKIRKANQRLTDHYERLCKKA